ncbi:MAG: hypothetical protein LQ341_005276, partial [Variospora aurantia]
MRKTRNEKTWKARPASRILFAVVGDLRFDWATPIRAAPATCNERCDHVGCDEDCENGAL